MPHILLTQPIHPQVQARLGDLGTVVVAPDTSPESLRMSASHCDVVVVRAQLPQDIFEVAPTLVGAVRHGAGVDMIPIEAATRRGVLVANAPGVNANAVAEHVLRSMLTLARRIPEMSAALASRAQGWVRSRAFAESGFELRGRVLGLVGFGHVGQAIARVCGEALSMQVMVHTRSPLPQSQSTARRVALDVLLQACDFLVLACPLTSETRGLIGAAELARMRPGSFLVNVARGPVVVDGALIQALRSGHLAGAAIDVFDAVPLDDSHPFWDMQQVVMTPHVAGITDDSMRAIGQAVVVAVEHMLRGAPPPHCVNPQALPAFLRRFG